MVACVLRSLIFVLLTSTFSDTNDARAADGDDLFDKLNPARKVGNVDQDEDIVVWLSPEFEKEHLEKRGYQEDEPDKKVFGFETGFLICVTGVLQGG